MADDPQPTDPNDKPLPPEPAPTPVHAPGPAPTPDPVHTAGKSVKVDLSELRDALDGMPEKIAQFMRESMQPPKQPRKPEAKSDDSPVKKTTESAPTGKGWLAKLLGL